MLISIFPLLWEYAYLRDMFRLAEAIQHTHRSWSAEELSLVRKILVVPRRLPLGKFLISYMSRPRCRQCGRICHRTHPRFCMECTRWDEHSPVLMVNRTYIENEFGMKQARHILSVVKRVKRGGNGAYLYWKRDIHEAESSAMTNKTHKRPRSI